MEKKIGQIWRLFLQMGMKKIKIQISLVVPKNNPERPIQPIRKPLKGHPKKSSTEVKKTSMGFRSRFFGDFQSYERLGKSELLFVSFFVSYHKTSIFEFW